MAQDLSTFLKQVKASNINKKYGTHSSVADDGSLSFLQSEDVSAVGGVRQQGVEFGILVGALEQ